MTGFDQLESGIGILASMDGKPVLFEEASGVQTQKLSSSTTSANGCAS